MILWNNTWKNDIERYNIVNEDDFKKAPRQVEEYNQKKKEETLNQKPGTDEHNTGTNEKNGVCYSKELNL